MTLETKLNKLLPFVLRFHLSMSGAIDRYNDKIEKVFKESFCYPALFDSYLHNKLYAYLNSKKT